jgi:hypothetical protein
MPAPAAAGRAVAAGPTSGVPHFEQNLNVAALALPHFGHCFGGPAARTPLIGAARLGAGSSIRSGAPHDKHDPTSVSFTAPHFGHSIGIF